MACVRRLIALLLLLALPGWGAITFQLKGAGNDKTSGTTLYASTGGANITTGASVVVTVAHDPVTVSSVELKTLGTVCTADDGSLLATLVNDVETTNTGNVQVSIWSSHNVAANGNCIKVTFASAITAKAVRIVEFLGANGALVFSTSSTGTSTGTAVSTGSITCTPNSGADCAWYGGVGAEDNEIDQNSPAWTNPNNAASQDGTEGGASGSNITAIDGYEIDSGAVTQALNMTLESSADWAAVMATYKEPAAGGAVLKDLIMRGLLATPR